MNAALLVALGSAAGGVTRYLVGGAIQARLGAGFPLGTLVINITGSFLFGFLVRLAMVSPAVDADLRILLTTGFCGGYTTFSAFSFETVALIEAGEWRKAAAYIALSVALSVAGTLAGLAAARSVASR